MNYSMVATSLLHQYQCISVGIFGVKPVVGLNDSKNNAMYHDSENSAVHNSEYYHDNRSTLACCKACVKSINIRSHT